jgi:hypothetical protein
MKKIQRFSEVDKPCFDIFSGQSIRFRRNANGKVRVTFQSAIGTLAKMIHHWISMDFHRF